MMFSFCPRKMTFWCQLGPPDASPDVRPLMFNHVQLSILYFHIGLFQNLFLKIPKNPIFRNFFYEVVQIRKWTRNLFLFSGAIEFTRNSKNVLQNYSLGYLPLKIKIFKIFCYWILGNSIRQKNIFRVHFWFWTISSNNFSKILIFRIS